ncbi:MAG: phytanoyl-CoA dioxygenase family protein [Burkholderiales bacterium]|nr:phytanoyl-CoA dioxygenase family protein [Burkholderiales bacterium]
MNPLQDQYRRNGYAICSGMVDLPTVQALREEAIAIACGQRGTIDGVAQLDDDGEPPLKNVLAIHFPHKVSSLMREMLSHPAIVEVLTQLIGLDVKCMQSMLFVKNAGKPGQAWHQDETFIPTTDRSLTGVWIALDDATIDNGCLWMQPGSHARGALWPMQPCDDPRFDGAPEAVGWESEFGGREGGIAVEVPAGSVVFFNGFTLHRSLDNRRTSGYRRALVNHYMSARSQLPWKFGNSRFAPDDYRDVVVVAGNDPYAERGIEDLAHPFLRPETRKT